MKKMGIDAWHQAITATILFNLLVPQLAAPCGVFVLIQEDTQNIALFKTLTNKHSLTECFLVCCADVDCHTASFDNERKICNLYKSSNEVFPLLSDLSFFKKEESYIALQQTQQLVESRPSSITTQKPSVETCTDRYKTGPDCTEIIDPKELLNAECQKTNNEYVAVYSYVYGNLQWRCHHPNTLSTDQLFYINGTDYDGSYPVTSLLRKLIDQHPFYVTSLFEMSHPGKSCDHLCVQRGKICNSNPKALDSMYTFMKAGKVCHHFDTRPGGDSYWSAANLGPLLEVETDICKGFIGSNGGRFKCDTEPRELERMICRCEPSSN